MRFQTSSHHTHLLFILLVHLWLVACHTQPDPQTIVASVATVPTTNNAVDPAAATIPLPSPSLTTARPTTTPMSTATPMPTATFTPTATPTPSPTPIGPCNQRLINNDLLAIVTKQYGLSPAYAPTDLVTLTGHLPVEVTLGYPTSIRQIALEPLVTLVTAMQAQGLKPTIISGYRSYSSQAAAYQKWLDKEPERVDILSAPPGHSEHQLGTTIDFGSPELPDITGIPEIEFHTYFYQTSEGQWLLHNAHRYGFSLSYPLDAFELTGFYYEPWHYRYIGTELATQLYEENISLTAYQLANLPEPCIP